MQVYIKGSRPLAFMLSGIITVMLLAGCNSLGDSRLVPVTGPGAASASLPADLVRIGDSEYGFISIPRGWEVKTDLVDPIRQYSDPGTGLVIMVMRVEGYDAAEAVAAVESIFQEIGAGGIEGSDCQIDRLSARRLTSSVSDGTMMAAYVFTGPDGLVRVISVTTQPEGFETAEALVMTYSLTQ